MSTTPEARLLPLADAAGCACATPHHEAAVPGDHLPRKANDLATSSYPVTGLTCGHCVAAVTDGLSAIPGVRVVSVALNTGGTSTVTVTSDAALTDVQVGAALDEAGDYRLAASN